MDVVAEAVEEPMVLDQLREVGCDFAQGFLLGHPTPGELVFDPISASPTHPLIAALHPQH
jgi:EAL domain-containing protein (putative c-di-GMP-specific phosphodiesterase class I)